jgi:hypothetical protein
VGVVEGAAEAGMTGYALDSIVDAISGLFVCVFEGEVVFSPLISLIDICTWPRLAEVS